MTTYTGRPCRLGHDGLRYLANSVCVTCAKARAKAERYSAVQINARKRWQQSEKGRAAASQYRDTEGYRVAQRRYAKTEARKVSIREWGKRNRAKTRAACAAYEASKIKATPAWLTSEMRAAINATYAVAVRLGLTVDHIEPIRGRLACGLHVPWNLQLLTASENSRKSNKRAK